MHVEITGELAGICLHLLPYSFWKWTSAHLAWWSGLLSTELSDQHWRLSIQIRPGLLT
ncbi:hypothetical protein I79_015462 [Cricetulus griseus]|uniref:Uncharacterized protein n=1 Tax=Cricetulus griseus TaxID=10029 RepID=G3HWU9_CRIGR|nr:hypothetical protein I79_015462 [Cricetulus griseus]